MESIGNHYLTGGKEKEKRKQGAALPPLQIPPAKGASPLDHFIGILVATCYPRKIYALS
ncbi:hypothetical protein MBAV_006417, partial [Candidatus Magnetobacterium bavaricum]